MIPRSPPSSFHLPNSRARGCLRSERVPAEEGVERQSSAREGETGGRERAPVGGCGDGRADISLIARGLEDGRAPP